MPFLTKGNGGGKGSSHRGLSSSLASNMLAPRQLLQQILVMQGIYYLIGFILILFTCIVSGDSFTMSMVFSWEPVRIDTTMGWTLFLLWLLDTFFSVLGLTVVVGRSKLALDFTLTLHGIHFMVCWCVAGKFPASKLWWGLQVVSVLLMLLLGTWSTQWRELRATFFDPVPEAKTAQTLGGPSNTADALQQQYDEFELQESAPSPKASVSPQTASTVVSNPQLTSPAIEAVKMKQFDDFDEEFNSEDEGDLTAGSKLLRETSRR